MRSKWSRLGRTACLLLWAATVVYSLFAVDYRSSAEAEAAIVATESHIEQLKQQIEQARSTREKGYEGLRALLQRGPEVRELEREADALESEKFDEQPYEDRRKALDWKHLEAHQNAQNELAAFESDQSSIKKAQDAVAEAIEEVKRMEERKATGIKELQEGYYCSQCNRPASQIEYETGMSFQSHLNNVSGTAIPASQNIINGKIKEFDRNIDRAKERLKQAESNLENAKTQFQKNLEAKRAALRKMEDDHVNGQRRIQNEMTQARDAFEQKNGAAIDRVKKEINRKVGAFEGRKSALEDSIDAANRLERDIWNEIDRKRSDLSYARWASNFYGDIERRDAERKALEEKRQAERALREAKRKAKEAELAQKRLEAKRNDTRVHYGTSSFRPTQRGGSSLTEALNRELDNALSEMEEPAEQERPEQPTAEEEAAALYSKQQQENIEKAQRALAQMQMRQALFEKEEREREQRKREEELDAFEFEDVSNNQIPEVGLAQAQETDSQLARQRDVYRQQVARAVESAKEFSGALEMGTAVEKSLNDHVWEAESEGVLPYVSEALDAAWQRGLRRMTRAKDAVAGGVEGLQAALSEATESDPVAATQRFFERRAEAVSSRFNEITESARERIQKLDWLEKAESFLTGDSLREPVVNEIARRDYERTTGKRFEDLSDFEKDSERFFVEAQIITPPPTYARRFFNAFSKTVDHWTSFGSDEAEAENEL